MENKPANVEGTGKSKIVPFLAALIIVLGIIVVALGYLFYAQQEESKEIQSQLNAEKDSISNNLKNIMVGYDSLQINNDSLNTKLLAEQERVKQMYDELQKVKRVSYSKIKEYQKELGTLRAIMKDLLQDIDSLNTLNQELIAENIKVKQDYSTAKQTVAELETKTEELSSQVEKGSVIKARDIVAMAINRRGNEVTRARRVEKIRVCFTLNENSIAKAGNREVFLRITGPDEYILAKSETDLFNFEGQMIVFSAKREVDYQNQDVEMCIFYDNNGELLKGVYKAALYMDGNLIGNTEFTLK
ncbi:MAG: hypothetical protein JW783_09460 [Bacteroidales bacterium]|nr:hypothetical protein [Bacteroidales bacterium]MBN2748054.1 hypothetical protein [Bacteroidales bacterium]